MCFENDIIHFIIKFKMCTFLNTDQRVLFNRTEIEQDDNG